MNGHLNPSQVIRSLRLWSGRVVRCVGTAQFLGPNPRCVLVDCGPQSHLTDSAKGLLLKMAGVARALTETPFITVGGPAVIKRVLVEGTLNRSPVKPYSACLENLTELTVLDNEDQALHSIPIDTIGVFPESYYWVLSVDYADDPEGKARRIAQYQKEVESW